MQWKQPKNAKCQVGKNLHHFDRLKFNTMEFLETSVPQFLKFLVLVLIWVVLIRPDCVYENYKTSLPQMVRIFLCFYAHPKVPGECQESNNRSYAFSLETAMVCTANMTTYPEMCLQHSNFQFPMSQFTSQTWDFSIKTFKVGYQAGAFKMSKVC